MKIFKKVIFLIFLSAWTTVSAESLNAGFVNGLWYSQTPFFAGDNVRIYTVIQNQSGFDILGTVQFFDNTSLLGESNFSIVNGRLVEQWADWVPSQGKHDISVKISNAQKIEIGKSPESIDLTNNVSISEVYNVAVDTDGDGVGDKEDLDDDGDGVSDDEEIANGTDPLSFNKEKISAQPNENHSINSSVQANSQTEEKTTTNTAKILSQANQLLGSFSEKAVETVDNTKSFLEKHQAKIKAEIKKEKAEAPLKDEPKIDANKNPYVASLVDNLPALKEIYNFFLSGLIYILNSWWILLTSLLVVLYFLFKIAKRILRRRY